MRPVIIVAGARAVSFRCCRSDNSNAKMLEGDGHGTRAKNFLEIRALTAARRPQQIVRIRENRCIRRRVRKVERKRTVRTQ